eukprot:gene3132-13144_t
MDALPLYQYVQEVISDGFKTLYGTLPDAVARAPGRVNLIGEHIDYSGFGVLPMAIQQDCHVGIKAVPCLKEACVVLASTSPSMYPSTHFPLPMSPSQPEGEGHNWSRYVWAACKVRSISL